MAGIAGMLGDFAGGFVEQSNKHRDDNQRLQQHQDDQEQAALLAIANSPDVRPEMRGAAITGLLTRGQGGKKQSGFQKWFGQHEAHPAFGQVMQMLNGGVAEGASPSAGSLRGSMQPAAQQQPGVGVGEQESVMGLPAARPARPATVANQPPPGMFFGPGEEEGLRQGAVTSAGIHSRVAALDEAAAGTHYKPTPQDYEQAYTGRAPVKTPAARVGTIVYADGTSEPGSQDPESHGFLDSHGNPAEWNGKTMSRFVPSGNLTSGSANPSTGGKWAFVEDGPNSDNGKWTHYDAMGKVMGQPVPGTRTAPPAFTTVIQDTEGAKGITRGGSARPIPGVGPAATAPSTNAGQLREELRRIDAAVKQQVATQYAGFPTPDQTKTLQDQAARASGYESYAALQAAAGAATRDVGGFVPTASQPPPDVQAPKLKTAGAGPGKAKAPTKGAQNVPAKSPTALSPGVQRALDALNALDGR